MTPRERAEGNARAVVVLREGGSLSAAAEAAGVSRPALDKRARSDETLAAAMAEARRKPEQPEPREEPGLSLVERARLYRLWGTRHLSLRQVADELGVTVGTLQRIAREEGLPDRPRARGYTLGRLTRSGGSQD